MGGDVYAEQRDVYRGVTLSNAFPGDQLAEQIGNAGYEQSKLAQGGFEEASYYDHGGGDHVTRGVRLGFCEYGTHVGPKFDNMQPDDQPFDEGDKPPPVPATPFFKLATNTFKVSTPCPWGLGNCLVAYLLKACNSDILKDIRSRPTEKKFFVKALVFVQSAWCVLKAKVYEETPPAGSAPGRYAVCFERRSGDALAFNNAYLSCAKYVSECGGFESMEPPPGLATYVGGTTPVLFPPELSLPDTDDDDEGPPPTAAGGAPLGPLLDMAAGNRAQQAESASAIAELIEDGGRRSPTGTPPVLRALDKLLEVNQTIVAYPTVKAVKLLATRGDTEIVSFIRENWARMCALSKDSGLVRRECDELLKHMNGKV